MTYGHCRNTVRCCLSNKRNLSYKQQKGPENFLWPFCLYRLSNQITLTDTLIFPTLQDHLTGLISGHIIILKNQGTPMTHQILTDIAASISELKANPMKVVASGEGMPIAVLNRNEPAFYCVPAKAYEAMMDLIEDKELLAIAKSRMDEESIKVKLDDL